MAKQKIKKGRITLLVYLILSILTINLIYSNKPFANIQKLINHVVIPTPIPIPLKSLEVPILVYHYVENVTDNRDTIRKSLNTNPQILIKQIETLKNAAYTFITPKELMDIMDGKMPPPKKSVILSFDDGYRDFYTDVFPILKKYQVKAVAYIVSGFLDKPNYMFTWQIKEVAKSGLVEIGAHTIHHIPLTSVLLEQAKSEIEGGKTALEKLLNIPIVSFAYPDGRFDEQIAKLAERAGFRSSATTIHGNIAAQENKYFLYRIHPGQHVDSSLLNFISK